MDIDNYFIFMDMEKVVILVRVSTDKQEFQRQINELTEYCQKNGLED